LEEAYNMIKDAMAAWLEVAIEEGEKVPLPQVLEEEKYSGRILLRLPKSLHRKLIENAKEEGVSLNQYIVYLISERNKENKLNQILSHIRREFANVRMDELNVEADYLIGRYKVSFPKKIFKKPELKWSH
ncbi:MAG TPA: toxin-antitoxin system HicB family antitoxin, partial [Candidatus Atribacteria bacterium]|nr:toxin-antitoxin system HicB family antitoxin [Candidatus Atribacteria bacterium]